MEINNTKICGTCSDSCSTLFKCQQCTYEACLSCLFKLAIMYKKNDETKCPQCRSDFYVTDLDRPVYISCNEPRPKKMFKFAALPNEINLYELGKHIEINMPFKRFYEMFREGFDKEQNLQVLSTIGHNFILSKFDNAPIRPVPVSLFEFQSRACRDTMLDDKHGDVNECILKRTLTRQAKLLVFDIDNVKFTMSVTSKDPEHTCYYCLVCDQGRRPTDHPFDDDQTTFPIKASIPKHLKSATHHKNLTAVIKRLP